MKRHTRFAALVCVASIGLLTTTIGQEVLVRTTIGIDVTMIGLNELNPPPLHSQTGEVFGNQPLMLTIAQWSDGKITVTSSARSLAYDVTNSTGSGAELQAGAEFTLNFVTASGSVMTSKTASSSTTANVTDSIEFEVTGDLVEAVLVYTDRNGVKHRERLSVGTINSSGGFKSAPGKEGAINAKNVEIYGSHGSIARTADGRRGVASEGTSDLSEVKVLVGFYVQTATVNGVVLSVEVAPIYATMMAKFQQFGTPTTSISNIHEVLK